jgi:hypothetical protein
MRKVTLEFGLAGDDVKGVEPAKEQSVDKTREKNSNVLTCLCLHSETSATSWKHMMRRKENHTRCTDEKHDQTHMQTAKLPDSIVLTGSGELDVSKLNSMIQIRPNNR